MRQSRTRTVPPAMLPLTPMQNCHLWQSDGLLAKHICQSFHQQECSCFGCQGSIRTLFRVSTHVSPSTDCRNRTCVVAMPSCITIHDQHEERHPNHWKNPFLEYKIHVRLFRVVSFQLSQISIDCSGVDLHHT